MIIIQAIQDHIEELLERPRIPSVESLRPTSCPLCGNLAFSPGKPFGIVGHGTYTRQVLGIVEAAREVVTWVRRYFCHGCGHTISVLSDHLHPGRWYAASVILKALWLHLIEEKSESEIRECFGIEIDSESWRSLRCWRTELLVTLWSWFSKRHGVRDPAATRTEGRRRLKQLFAEAGGDTDIRKASRNLATSRVYYQGFSWPLGHAPPEELKRKHLHV